MNGHGEDSRKMKRALSLIDKSSDWVGKVACFAVIIVAIIMTVEVISRYGFNRPTIWVWDIGTQLGAALYMLGGAYVLLHHAHVRVDVLYSRFPPRVQAITDLITSLFFFFFCVVLVWKGAELAVEAVASREAMNSILAPPLYPLRWLFVVASFLLLLQGAAKFIRDLNIAIRGKGIDL